MEKMTIREYYEKHKVDVDWGAYVTAEPINQYADEFLSADYTKTFYNLVEKDEDWLFYINEDVDGDLFVTGNEGYYKTYFDDNLPMVEVYYRLIDIMNKVIEKIETETEKDIKAAEYKVSETFKCASASDTDFGIDYDDWWNCCMGETQDWIKGKYFNEFCGKLYDYFVEYAKDYGYDVKEVDGGLDMNKN